MIEHKYPRTALHVDGTRYRVIAPGTRPEFQRHDQTWSKSHDYFTEMQLFASPGITDTSTPQLPPPDTLAAAAEEAVKALRSAAATIFNDDYAIFLRECEQAADRLAAAIEQRGR